MSTLLAPESRDAALAALDGWLLAADGASIQKSFVFADFVAAFAFMTRVAFAAERLEHHPDWSNSYRTVSVRLSTHDAGGLTERDFALAAAIDMAASPESQVAKSGDNVASPSTSPWK